MDIHDETFIYKASFSLPVHVTLDISLLMFDVTGSEAGCRLESAPGPGRCLQSGRAMLSLLRAGGTDSSTHPVYSERPVIVTHPVLFRPQVSPCVSSE